ncbi:MAG: fibrobacter succinogenes major paralogous domain-containing protein [Bacteroidales bacterium]|nr:fibrobacter succinogenes major paralogous domain-containing protein [Bacteroidales bacterium]
MKNRLSIFLLPLLLGACVQLGDSPVRPAEDGETVPVALTLNVAAVEDGMPGSKADIYYEPEDPAFDAAEAIRTVLLLQFDGEDADAQLIGQQQYFDHWPLVAAQGEGFALVARSTPQTVVVIANSFGYLPLTDHTTLGNFMENENYKVIGSLDGVWHEVVDGADHNFYLPMGGHVTLASLTTETSIPLTLRRNCAKVVINVKNGAYNGTGNNKVIIEDVRMCQINAKNYYVTDFTTAGGADPFDFEDPYDNLAPMRFDAAEQTGAFLNDGDTHTLTYYLPANLRGSGANTSGSQKQKNLGAPLGATCFKIYAHYGDSENPIVYTYYLGGDLVNDFNLKSNTKYTYNITLSGKGTPANDYRIYDQAVRTEFTVDANCYMLLPPDRVGRSLTYTIPVRRAMVFWNTPDAGCGVYGASGGDNEVLTLTESTPWKVSFIWNRVKDENGDAVADGELLVDSVEESGKYVFSSKGFDPGYTGAAIDGRDPYFRIKVANGMKGDALVALKNTNGVILWSWHLWVTDYNPDVEMTPVSGTYVYPVPGAPGSAIHRYFGTIWRTGKAYENAFIMDRNLGAVASTGRPDDTRGAYYQFGRKDPLYKDISGTNGSSGELIAAGVHNPDKYFSKWNADDPLSSRTAIWGDPKLINGVGHGGDNCEANKSIYDPCPPGWKVPVGGGGAASIWEGFNTSGWSEWFTSPAGRKFYPEGNPEKGSIWYPYSGAWIAMSALDSYWLSATPYPDSDGIRCYALLVTNGGVDIAFVYPGGHQFHPRKNAMSVRCVRLR